MNSNLDDVLNSFQTHNKRLEVVMKSLNVDAENLRLLHQLVEQNLVYMGYDLKAEEFVNEHNRVFSRFMGNLESMMETFVDLGIDVVKTIDIEIEAIDKRMGELKE